MALNNFDYTVTVPSTTTHTYVNTTGTGTLSTGTSSWGLGSTTDTFHYHYSGYCSGCYPYTNYWTVQPTKIYMYQISCPKCETKTFGELDTVVKCKKCKSTIKLVSKVTDYEVAVDL